MGGLTPDLARSATAVSPGLRPLEPHGARASNANRTPPISRCLRRGAQMRGFRLVGSLPARGREPMNDWLKLKTSIRQAVDPLQLMQRVADQALAMIDNADGVLIGPGTMALLAHVGGLVVEAGQLRHVCGAGILASHVGELLPLDGSLSGETIRAGETLITGDTERDPRVDLGATRAYGVRSAVCVPLMRGGERVGVLTVGSAGPRAFEQHDVLLLSSLADFMSAVIGAALDFTTITARLLAERQAGSRRGVPVDTGDAALAERFVENVLDPSGAKEHSIRSRVKRILEGPGFSLVFQPIFELEGGGLFCTEALARFGDEPDEPPDIVIAAAHQVGLGVELEAAIIELAAAQLGQLPGWGLLAVNAGPGALASSRVAEALARSDPERIIVELTEHVRVDDYARLADAARALRHMGVRLAIDDAGAGFASLMHILKLAPDFIKLDRELVTGIDLDPVRRSLVESLLRFADETGALIIAECIETEADLGALRDLDVRYGQGFYLARPGPLSAIRQAIKDGSARMRAQRAAQGARPTGAGAGAIR